MLHLLAVSPNDGSANDAFEESLADSPTGEAVIVRHGLSKQQLREFSLVLDAMGIDYGVVHAPRTAALVVAPADVMRALEHLDSYERDAAHWPPREAPLTLAPVGWGSLAAYVLVLVGFHLAQIRHAAGIDWTARGMTDANLITGGAWWRATTALCLHADVEHLVGNVIFGAIFALFATQLLGSGLAWCATLLAGTAGNLLNAVLAADGHRSLGASTAVFSTLGILVAYQWVRRRELEDNPLRRWGPPVMGLGLLNMLGTSGERTDIMAHILGWGTGIVAGLILGAARDRLPPPRPARILFGLVVPLVLGLCWWLALRRAQA